MSSDNIIKLDGYKVWHLTSSNISETKAALKTGLIDGVAIARCHGYTDINLECLAQFSNLRALAINDVEGIDTSYIGSISNLEFLLLSDTDSPVALEGLTRLRHLRFEVTKGIQIPKNGLPELRLLAIRGVQDSDLSILAHYPQLESLEIIQASKLGSLNGLEACLKLEELVLAYCPKLQDIDALVNATNLRSLDLENTKAVESYSALGKLISLKKLIIDKSAPLVNLDFTSALTHLEHLVIRSTPIENCDLSPLLLLPVLSHIYMDSKKEYQPTLKKLEQLVKSRK